MKYFTQWPGLVLAFLLLAAPVHAELPDNAVWIDVRTVREFAGGHLAAAHSIPYDGIEAGVAGLKLDKDTPVFLYCAVGGRAEIAKQRLERLGYSNVTNVGGLADAQKLAGEPAP